jgi:RNA polymerase sigma factor for flagellar operon FliA
LLSRGCIEREYEDCGLSLPSVECVKMESTSTFESIESYFPLVDKILKWEIRKLSLNSKMGADLRSHGIEGLLNAARTFDSSRGATFETYAAKRIRWAIYDGIRKMGWFPRHAVSKAKFYRKADEILSAKGKEPSPVDKTEAVHRLSGALKELTAVYIISYSEDALQNVEAENASDAELSVDMKRIVGRLRHYMNSLPKKERHILVEFFFEDRTLTEIAEDMAITRSWASKLLSSGLRRLRHLLGAHAQVR